MLRLLAFLLLLPAAVPTAMIAGPARSILVLDASGSMWGQIDGINKIVIARDVISDLLTTLPEDLDLGLMAYGHRRKGDCGDIELLIAPTWERDQIANAVNAISPKGKTPLSAAVIQAAEALNYTEDAATVILVSDGIETCDYDPCEVGRTLEAAGIDFTAHVIGFDVADPAARAQLQCLADETGGTFRTAANAEELADALSVVAAEPARPPEPMPVSAVVTFRATEGPGGPVITEGLTWNIATELAGEIIVNDTAASELLDIFPSPGTATVTRASDGATADTTFTVVDDTAMTVTLVLPAPLPPPLPEAIVSGPMSAPVGSTIEVTWTGPNVKHDYISVARPDAVEGSMTAKSFTSEGNPLKIRLPMDIGPYEIRYVLNDGSHVLATQAITLTEIEAALSAPEAVTAGAELSIDWTGPNYDRDYIAISRADTEDNSREAYAYTGNGNPATFQAPTTPGAYELRYYANDNGKKVIARRPITLTEARATLIAPATAPAGSTLTVGWSGNGAARDLITLAREGDSASAGDVKERLRGQAEVALTLPATPGRYELRYVQDGDPDVILAAQALVLTPVSARLTAPASAAPGGAIEVAFEGPGNPNDFIVITRPEEAANKRSETGYPRNGSPVTLRVPAEPGAWEIRYLLGGPYGEIIARLPLRVE